MHFGNRFLTKYFIIVFNFIIFYKAYNIKNKCVCFPNVALTIKQE